MTKGGRASLAKRGILASRHRTARHTTSHHCTPRHCTTPHNTTLHPVSQKHKPSKPMHTVKTENTSTQFEDLEAANRFAAELQSGEDALDPATVKVISREAKAETETTNEEPQ